MALKTLIEDLKLEVVQLLQADLKRKGERQFHSNHLVNAVNNLNFVESLCSLKLLVEYLHRTDLKVVLAKDQSGELLLKGGGVFLTSPKDELTADIKVTEEILQDLWDKGQLRDLILELARHDREEIVNRIIKAEHDKPGGKK